MCTGIAKIGHCGDGKQSLKVGICKMCSDEMVKVSAEEVREIGGRGAGQRKAWWTSFRRGVGENKVESCPKYFKNRIY